MRDLKGKWALVTGASRGVGKQISLALAQQGCNVILHSRKIEHTTDLLTEIRQLGVSAQSVYGDLNDQAQVDAMLDKALKMSPQIDILYNNAVIMTPYHSDFWNTPAKEFRQSFEVNTISLIRICHRLVPLMLARRSGVVINTTSGIADEPELTAYAISKAALNKFVADLVPKLKDSGVQMNLLDPGWLRTDLGGPNAPNSVESVIPGALIPALLNDGISGRLFHAQDFAGLSIEESYQKALEKYK
ncbi:MAG: SDR family oxidoreductase [Fibrobacter sp.]|nr:SDR family oxidoreductase [Fibrobacter sp.]